MDTMNPTRVEIEAQIQSIADECAFTMPFWLAGLLEAECRRQGLHNLECNGPGCRITVKIKQSPKKRLGAAGAQLQGRVCNTASQQTLTPNEKGQP